MPRWNGFVQQAQNNEKKITLNRLEKPTSKVGRVLVDYL
jgi:hypothetical protein